MKEKEFSDRPEQTRYGWRLRSGQLITELPFEYFLTADGTVIDGQGRSKDNFGEDPDYIDRPAQMASGAWELRASKEAVMRIGPDLFITKSGQLINSRGKLVKPESNSPLKLTESRWILAETESRAEPVLFYTEDGYVIDRSGRVVNQEEIILIEGHDSRQTHRRLPNVFPTFGAVIVSNTGQYQALDQRVYPFAFSTDDKVIDIIGREVYERFDLRGRPSQTARLETDLSQEQVIKTDFTNVATDLRTMEAFCATTEPLSKEVYLASLEKAMDILDEETGLVELDQTVPTIVVSDLHARRDFLYRLLEREIHYEDEQIQIFKLLQQGKINIVCVGDGMHSEKPYFWTPRLYQYQDDQRVETRAGQVTTEINDLIQKFRDQDPRWQNRPLTPELIDEIWDAMQSMNSTVQAVVRKYEQVMAEEEAKLRPAEMARSLGTMKLVMDLKAMFPHHFHFVRGNHDDADLDLAKAFYKEEVVGISKFGVNQTQVTQNWIEDHFGKTFFDRWLEFEDSLPSVALGKEFVVSHAPPSKILTAAEIDSREAEAVASLAFTDNRPGKGLEESQLATFISGTLSNLGQPANSLWFCGHRQVFGYYRQQCAGQLIQICSDDRQLAAYVPLGHSGSFNPERHITDLAESEK